MTTSSLPPDDTPPEGPRGALPEVLALDERGPPREPAEPDYPLAKLSLEPTSPVRLVDEGGEPAPIAHFRAEIAASCVEVIASLARDRSQRPLAERPGTEACILAQLDAVGATGSAAIPATRAFFHRALESPDPWKTWAAVFVLASITGAQGALVEALEQIEPGACDQAASAAEALSVVPRVDARALGRELLGSPHPVARAVGIDALSRVGALGSDELLHHLASTEAPILEAAILAGERAEPAPLPLARLMRSPHRAVAWRAARLLSLWGSREPYDELVMGESLAATLGPLSLELLIMHGSPRDAGWMSAPVSRWSPSPALLSAIARLGFPATWAFLLHFLDDEALAEPASTALATLFGPRVAPAEQTLSAAWREAIAESAWDQAPRYRRGQPWSPEVVLGELAGFELSRDETARRIDELSACTRTPARVDLGAFWPAPARDLAAFDAAVRARRGSVVG